MTASPLPPLQDVIVSRQPGGAFSVGIGSQPSQIVCDTLEEAIQQAGGLAAKRHLALWYTMNGRTCALPADVSLLRRVWNEYVEMPGLRLTPEQAHRLWAVDVQTCTSLLDVLVELKFLSRGTDRRYARVRPDVEADPIRIRMARVCIDTPSADARRHAS
jgi:hypothetical protein